MAWVNLYNLFEKDKNFYGALNELLDETVEVKATEFLKKYGEKGAVELVESFDGKPLKDIIKSNISTPEWSLDKEGKLVNFDMFDVKGDISVQNMIEINILPLLAEMSDKQLRAIADSTFIQWRYENDTDYELPINHPQWEAKDHPYIRSKKRTKQAQQEFFNNIKKAREEM
ncbi:hypothetical protein LCGC14_1251200 [marine sediment metagenome]|uniref:Uncharacterized protein n=1 Tax=marine sediment metagenome TaxID=412755 RepID=A0A0F9P6X2_9ZZZZ